MTTVDKSSLPVVYTCNTCGEKEIGDSVSEAGSKYCKKCESLLSLYRPPKNMSDMSNKPWNRMFEELLATKGR